MADQTPPPSTNKSNDNDSTSPNNLTELQTEMSTLNRVSHRLAMTDAGPALARVLNVLLPRLLHRIGKNDDAKKINRRRTIHKRKSPTNSNDNGDANGMVYSQMDGMHETIHSKLIEMLGHTMKRVREDRGCKLPCAAILELLIPSEKSKDIVDATTVNAFTINLGLAFLTLGINRLPPVECSSLLPGLLKFLACNFDSNPISTNIKATSCSIGVGHLMDPSRKMRHDQTWHLILRCLESISHNPMETAAARRAASSASSNGGSSEKSEPSVASLHDTKHVMASNPILAAALFDLFADVFLYSPVSAASTLIPNGLSAAGYQRLVGGAASEMSLGCKNWKEEFVTRGSLRQLKLKLLDLIAPCRRYALFLPDNIKSLEKVDDGTVISDGDAADGSSGESNNKPAPVQGISDNGMGVSRTVALLVLLTGDSDPDVKNKAESYLRAHMDTYRGKEVPQASNAGAVGTMGDEKDATAEITVHDALLGNTVALAQTIMIFAIGGASSLSVEKAQTLQYKNATAIGILKSRLGLAYCADANSATQQKVFLSCSRKKISEPSATSALAFASKMLEDNPKLFHVGMDMEEQESDIAAVSIGTLALSVFGDLHRPGSSASSAMESAASLLNSLCVRLSLFYDVRFQSGLKNPESLERIRLLLAQSMKLACSVLAPTSSGESTTVVNNGTKASNVQIDIRDKCYGVVCTLARGQFALDDRHSLFDCGDSHGRPAGLTSTSLPLTTISSAKLLFGCASKEIEVLRPRATSALDALLGSYTRVVKFLAEQEAMLEREQESAVDDVVNPWANSSEPVAEAKQVKREVSTQGLSLSLLPLLWNAARRNQPKSSRLAAARWSSELLLCLDESNAYHILCFLSGDDDSTVSMIAKQAIQVDKVLGEDNVLTPDLTSSQSDRVEGTYNHATFSVLVDVIIGSQLSTMSRPKYADFPVCAQAATVRFLLQSLFSEESFYGDEDGGLALTDFLLTILKTLAYYKGRSLSRDEIDLLDECSIALASCTSTSKDARLVIVKQEGVPSDSHYSVNDIATQSLTSNSSKARRHLAGVMGHLYEDHSLWYDVSATKPFTVSAWIESSGLSNIAKICADKLSTIFDSSFALGEVHGAAFLGSSCVRAFRLAIGEKTNDEEDSAISSCWDRCCNIVSLLGKGLGQTDVAIGNACSKGIVITFSYDSQDAPILNQRLFDSLAVAMHAMNAALKKFSLIDHADPTRASSLIQAAGLLLAASTSGAGFTKGSVLEKDGSNSIDLGPSRLQCTESLFSILGSAVYRKDDELSLLVGESLSKYADAIGGGQWSSDSDSEWKEGPYDEAYAFNLPPHQHVLYTMFQREILSTNPMKRNACAATLLALIGHASRMANIDSSYIERAFVKEMWKHLGLFQKSFIKLLQDPKSKQLSRESCCKGLAACRGLAAIISSTTDGSDTSQSEIESLNDQLLKAFGQTTNYGGSVMQESEAQASQRRDESGGDNDTNGTETTQVGGVSGMSEATLGAYREMANAALSLGKVDVLYSLMILSTNHPLWLLSEMRDRYSAKALLGKAEGGSIEEIRVSLRPHLGKLIPKLLRACNDPNKQTREQMNNLWLALTGGGAESRAIVTQNLLPTIDVLISDAGSKLWRARVGACGALSDIIVGRSWQDLGGGEIEVDDEGSKMQATASIRLLRLWKITMRSLDDVRTAVRERGDSLGRGLRALTIRLCDPEVAAVSQESDIYLSNAQHKEREKQSQISAEYAATVSLGWLVKYGLNQQCAEATGICISCLLGIVDVAKPSTLQPVLAELIGSLLMAMSGLEPAALNYLQVRASSNDANSQGNSGPDSYDRLERLRINLASSGPIAGALQKCLEMVQFVDCPAQKKLIPELDSSLRKGAGFATRAATADAVGNLCGACPTAFSFPGASGLSNPTVRLLRALYFASERERGATAKDKMTHALGSLAELAPGSAVRILALKACERYCESSGSNNDPSVRKAAAATIRAICVRASNHLADGGPKDIWVQKVLPTAFIGRHDKDPKVSSLWKDVWDEGPSAISSMDGRNDVFGVLLQEKLLPYIIKATVSALRSTSWDNRKNGAMVLIELTDANILAPTPRSTGDESRFSGEDKARLKQRAKASSILLSECLTIIARNRIWDGKGDVVKAGTTIASKWSAAAPANGKSTNISDCQWPLVLRNDCEDDLFKGDAWFKLSEVELNEVNDQVGHDDADNAVNGSYEQNSDDSNQLDMSGENYLGDEEQLSGESAVESDTEQNLGFQPVVFSGFCRVLLGQALREGSNNSTEGVIPYKASALSGLAALLKSVDPNEGSKFYEEIIESQRFVYDLIAPSLYSSVVESQSSNGKSVPPLLIARALECLASAMYDGIGADASKGTYTDPVGLLDFFALSTGMAAWTVRQMSAKAASSLVAKMPSGMLRKNAVITTVIECSTQNLKDKKFWKVRLSGLELLLSLVSRVGNQKMSVESEKQLIMEAILPYKERIVDLARRSLADSEAKVTAAASKITLTMAWWP